MSASTKFGLEARRVNWPIAASLGVMVVALTSRIVLTRFYWVPRPIRFYLADFGSVTVFSVLLVCVIHLVFGRYLSDHDRLGRWIYMGMVLLSTGISLNVEWEDYARADEGDGFDPGVILDWLGAPSTDTYDPLDVVAIIAGGVLAAFLMWWATKSLRRWSRFPLFVRPPASLD